MSSRSLKIKICGITNLADARFTAELGADYIGFVFHKESPRYIEPQQVAEIIKQTPGPAKVGVFVNRSGEEVNETAALCRLDYVQLHGSESPAYCRKIIKPVIKAVAVGPGDTPEIIREKADSYAGAVDFLLFDTKSADLWGGTGKSFNWKLLKGLKLKTPFFIAGGLNADNIFEAVKTAHPFGADLSGGVELMPGQKSIVKVTELMLRVSEL